MNGFDADPDGLPESRLHTFVDGARAFTLHFLEGQRLIRDLALLHGVQGPGFAYFRDVVLSVQPMIAYLKRGEQLGFYIDSERPWFRLKIEASWHGDTRCTIVPDRFREFPEEMHGIVRVQKLFPHNRVPYTSVLRIDGLPLRAIVNRVLDESYQVHSAVVVSDTSDQSVLLHRLPSAKPGEDPDDADEDVRRRREQIAGALDAIFSRGLQDTGRVAEAFTEIGFEPLADRVIRFHCNCSRDRMLRNLALVARDDLSVLFDPGQRTLEVTCEYCKSRYEVRRDEVESTRAIH